MGTGGVVGLPRLAPRKDDDVTGSGGYGPILYPYPLLFEYGDMAWDSAFSSDGAYISRGYGCRRYARIAPGIGILHLISPGARPVGVVYVDYGSVFFVGFAEAYPALHHSEHRWSRGRFYHRNGG